VLESLFYDLVAEITPLLVTLPDKPEEDGEATVRALWHKAAGRALSVERAGQLELSWLGQEARVRLKALIKKRLQGTPLAHLTGRQHFMGIDFIVDARALIPRKETELLGYTALNKIDDILLNDKEHLWVMDLCSGSGNLACALAFHRPELRVIGSDISVPALTCARDNSRMLGLDDRVRFVAGDLLEAFSAHRCKEDISVIVCNPPYISNAKLDRLPMEIIRHEPREAFAGGPLGLSILNRLVKESATFLAGGGWVCCEVGLGQGAWLTQRFERTQNFQRVETFCDADGNIRVVAAQRNHCNT